MVGAARSDVWNSLWSWWWIAEGLADGHWPLVTRLLDHPDGGRLLVADPVQALLAAPMVLLAGPIVALNLVAWLQLTASGWAAWALARELGGRGWLAGAAFASSPLLLAHLHNGASEAWSVAWLPLLGLALHRLVQRGGWAWTLACGLGLTLCALASWYTGLAAWILVSSVLVLGLGQATGWHVRARRLLPAMGLALVLTAPLAHHAQHLARAEDGLVDIKRSEDLVRIRRTLGTADPRIFVTPGDFRSPDFATLEGRPGDYANVAYLGWTLLLLVGVGPLLGLRRAAPDGARAPPESTLEPALFLALALGLLTAMGPVLVLGGFPLDLGGRALPLPYRLVEDLPGFEALSLLWRVSVVSVLCLALLADKALARLGRAWVVPAAVALFLVEVHWLSPAADLPATSPVPHSPALDALATEAPGAVINLPVAANRAYLWEQTRHGHPLCAGLNTGANREALQVLASLRKLRRAQLETAAVRERARDLGIRYIVLHRDQLLADAFLPAVTALRDLEEPLHEDDLVSIWALW